MYLSCPRLLLSNYHCQYQGPLPAPPRTPGWALPCFPLSQPTLSALGGARDLAVQLMGHCPRPAGTRQAQLALVTGQLLHTNPQGVVDALTRGGLQGLG